MIEKSIPNVVEQRPARRGIVPNHRGPSTAWRQHIQCDPQRLGALWVEHARGPNISSTRSRLVIDQKRKLYFFELALTPNTFWVDLRAIDFSVETGTVPMLDLGSNQDHTYSGNATKEVKNAKPFEFLGMN